MSKLVMRIVSIVMALIASVAQGLLGAPTAHTLVRIEPTTHSGRKIL